MHTPNVPLLTILACSSYPIQRFESENEKAKGELVVVYDITKPFI